MGAPVGGPDAGLVVARVQSDAFCHNMVRALVGASVAVGYGQRPWSGPGRSRARGECAGLAVVAAHGLTLEEVFYPADDEVAAQADADPRATGGRGPAAPAAAGAAADG